MEWLALLLLGAMSGAVLVLWQLRTKPPTMREARPAVPEPPAPAEPPPAAATAASGEPETVAAALRRLGAAIGPRAEESAHPRELYDWAEFSEVVDVFRRPEVSLETLRQYAWGANWPLACAAFTALKAHPERGTLLQGILRQLNNLRPWVLYHALDFILSLEPRPPVGAVCVGAEKWWHEHSMIPDFFREHFLAREALGDAPGFGQFLEADFGGLPENIESLLKSIDHPYAGKLRTEVADWRARRIDQRFLASVGRLRVKPSQADLLIEPEQWQPALKHAESAVLQNPPRSILVTGETRTGKTSFISLLAVRLAAAGWSLFEATGAELMADQVYIGQLEGRIRQLIAELDARKRVAWYIADLPQVAESGTHKGQSASILDQIWPAISAGRLVILSEASPAGASRLFQSRPSLKLTMETYRLHPMADAEATALARSVADLMEQRLRVHASADAITTAMQLARQYLGSDQLPGSLIELVKRAMSDTLAAGARTVTGDHVLATVSQTTGLPRSILDDSERIDLASLRKFFTERVMGQSEAVDAIVERIAMLKAGLIDPDRPVGVFLFAGPTGTGKTELAKALAEYLFGSRDRMARLDMSEFQAPEATSKILGQRGGSGTRTDSLAERVRKQPFSVILLDEFEKAHPNTWDLFLQVMDDGRLTDADGHVVDFRHCLIIMTSNLGATAHQAAPLGFRSNAAAYSEEQVTRAIGQTFRPEFINRIDRVVVFQPLSRQLMRSILRKELAAVLARRGLRQRDWAVEWEASAIEFLLDRGFSPDMGARPLKRAIDQFVLAPLAATLVEHRFPEGDQFLFVRSDGRAIQVEFVDPDSDEAPDDSTAADDHVAAHSLEQMMLRPSGTVGERQALNGEWARIRERLAAPAWSALKASLEAEATSPGIWSRPDRQAVFARLALIDRVAEAARTADRLKARLEATKHAEERASRELVARVALQFYLLRDGLEDATRGAPIDVLLSVEPALEIGADGASHDAWCGRIFGMYRQWATRRHMQFREFDPQGEGRPAILQICGFGAFRTIEDEAGLHLLEPAEAEGGRRVAARVRIAAGPWEEPGPSAAHRIYGEMLTRSGESNSIVRRYRERPSPLVRCARHGWRTGRLETVLEGNFDLFRAIAG